MSAESRWTLVSAIHASVYAGPCALVTYAALDGRRQDALKALVTDPTEVPRHDFWKSELSASSQWSSDTWKDRAGFYAHMGDPSTCERTEAFLTDLQAVLRKHHARIDISPRDEVSLFLRDLSCPPDTLSESLAAAYEVVRTDDEGRIIERLRREDLDDIAERVTEKAK